MKSLKEQGPTRFKLLQIGESGSGKTTRALSATRFGKVAVFDFDGKLRELRSRVPKDQWELIESETFKTYDAALEDLQALEKDNPYSTVVIDTWSLWHSLAIDKQKSLYGNRKAKLSWDDWSGVRSFSETFLNTLLGLECNIIINAHAEIKESKSGYSVLSVGTTGSFGLTLPHVFQETHALEQAAGGKYTVRGLPSSRNYTYSDGQGGKLTGTLKIIANTGLAEDKLDSRGLFKVTDLSIFDDSAYRKEPNGKA